MFGCWITGQITFLPFLFSLSSVWLGKIVPDKPSPLLPFPPASGYSRIIFGQPSPSPKVIRRYQGEFRPKRPSLSLPQSICCIIREGFQAESWVHDNLIRYFSDGGSGVRIEYVLHDNLIRYYVVF